MSSKNFIARGQQSLYEHSHSVAERACRFLDKLGPTTKAVVYTAGLLHDIGKSAQVWQDYINGVRSSSGIHHSVAGACCARDMLRGDNIAPAIRLALVYAILGHHAGIPDYGIGASGIANGKTVKGGIKYAVYKEQCVDEAIKNCSDLVDEVMNNKDIWDYLKKDPIANTYTPISRSNFHMWTRLITSALIDADHLDAEAYENPGNAATRGCNITMAQLFERYNEWCSKHVIESDTLRGRQRREIRDACIRSARSTRNSAHTKRIGIYKLCAPTGSGKTLSSLVFALNHASCFGKERIIYVVPYISIIEQTADLFRAIFGEENVIEHHSKYDVTALDNEDAVAHYQNAIENWDAPIIITTASQFYETCMAAKIKVIRKLHNVVNSVVVIDEVQALPNHAINAAIGSMKTLSTLANTTFFLMTATMPDYSSYGQALGSSPYLELLKDEDSTDIIKPSKAKEYFAVNPPIHYEWTKDTDDYDTIASEIVEERTDVLAITNTKLICRTLYERVRSLISENERYKVYHLSNTMCGAHLSLVLREIREKLEENRMKRVNGQPIIPIRVISTSLVEAGVDIDFPVVYREIIGLDSIIQAAGRCNREGKYDLGKVRIFNSLYRLPDTRGIAEGDEDINRRYLPYVLDGIFAMREVMNGRDISQLDILFRDPEFIMSYYCALYGTVQAGEYARLINSREYQLPFRSVGDDFRLIEDQSVGILVHYDTNSERLIEQLKDSETYPKRGIIRKLRRYVVSLNERSVFFTRLLEKGAIKPVQDYDRLYEQQPELLHYDHDKTGLDILGNTKIPII